ncbi:MAG: PTS sugar transporter subunit IIA [Treponema sp.]|nr:PTS sugar transporter subunit IIA [Treponema sp.]MCL2272177.1 PTS sugar transporter subunit IIA [Treponema sp.]
MILQDVLNPESILIDLKSCNKDEAFNELVTHYCKVNKSSAYSEIFDTILKREEKMSTGIHKGIAFPHGKTDAVDKVRSVIGISKKGVNYDALDGEPVHILFMVISPMEESNEYLRLLKHIANLLEISQFQNELRSQADAIGVYNVICKYEKTLTAKKPK